MLTRMAARRSWTSGSARRAGRRRAQKEPDRSGACRRPGRRAAARPGYMAPEQVAEAGDRLPRRSVALGGDHLQDDHRPARVQARNAGPDDGGNRRRRAGTIGGAHEAPNGAGDRCGAVSRQGSRAPLRPTTRTWPGISAIPVGTSPPRSSRRAQAGAASTAGAMAGGLAVLLAVAAAVPFFPRGSTSAPLAQARALLDRYDKQANVDRAIALLSAVVHRRRRDPSRIPAGRGVLPEVRYVQSDPTLAARAGEEAGVALTINQSYAPAHVVLADDQLRSGPLRRCAGRSAASRLARRAGTAARGASSPVHAPARPAGRGRKGFPDGGGAGAGRLDGAERPGGAVPHPQQARCRDRRVRAHAGPRAGQHAGVQQSGQCIPSAGTVRQGDGNVRAVACRWTRTRPRIPTSARRCTSRAGTPTRPARSKVPWSLPGATFLHWFNLGAACYWVPDRGARERGVRKRGQAGRAGANHRGRGRSAAWQIWPPPTRCWRSCRPAPRGAGASEPGPST